MGTSLATSLAMPATLSALSEADQAPDFPALYLVRQTEGQWIN
jgi:hypothetical protein